MSAGSIYSGYLVVPTAILLTSVCSLAADYYVNAASRGSSGAGLEPGKAFGTIQEACDVAAPGDVVHVAPGVYFENIQLKNAGQPGRPITFRASDGKQGSVTVTAAREDIRKKSVSWEIVDPALNLYAIPHPAKPSRVLYDGVDLLPYPDLESLKKFRFAEGYPGTLHGFAFSNGTLYVRLHASGRYGSLDPNGHTMAVAPAGSGFKGAAVQIKGPRDYIWGVVTGGPSHVILDGFTFETPGIAAIYAPDGDVTVRNCWFVGCRSGVAGRPVVPDSTKNTNRVTIENCDYHQFPAFDDMKEVIELHLKDPWRADGKQLKQRIYWWQRKGDQKGDGISYTTTYESGMATDIGNDWVIRRCHVHDALEALSMWGVDLSTNLQVYENRFERLIDNAIEAENRAVNLSFHHNEVVDVFEPFSWQPLRAVPWPGPIYIYENLVLTTPAGQGLWKKTGTVPGVWKLGASENNWQRTDIKLDPHEPVRAPGEGFLAFNNTVICPGSVAITRIQSPSRFFENFFLFNNVFVLDDLSTNPADRFANIGFAANVGVFLAPQDPATTAAFTANDGVLLPAVEQLGMLDPGKGDFSPGSQSPAIGKQRPSSPPSALANAGAIVAGKAWTLPPVGPQASGK